VRRLEKRKEELIAKLLELYPGKKISCTQARKFAEDYNVQLVEMGDLCDEAGLKIYACELGCF